MHNAPSETTGIEKRPLRALLIEHDAEDVELCIHILEKESFEVSADVVQSLQEFGDRIRSSAYDVILADYKMPDWLGIEALTVLHREGIDIPFILVTGTLGEEMAVECIKLGATDFVLKDRLVRLPVAVSRALGEKALRDEQRRTADALRESEERFRLLAENAQDMIYRYRLRPTRGFEYVSPAATAITGYTPEDHYADPDLGLKIVHPEDRPLLEPFLQSLNPLSGPLTLRWIRKDGTIIWTEQLNVPILDEEGTVTAFEGIARDITERKRSEQTREALYRASLEILAPLDLEERLTRLLDTAQTILELDRVNILLADESSQWLQAAASAGTTEPLESIRVPIGAEGGAIARAYMTQQAVVWDDRGPVPDEMRPKPPHDRIDALRSRIFANVPLVVYGRAIGVLGVDREHSQRPFEPTTVEMLRLFAGQAALAIENARLYEAQRQFAQHLEATVEARTQELHETMDRVEQASRFKSEFLANMSHELRTPLNAVIGFAELLRDQQFGPLNEKQIRYVQNIWTSGKYLLQLINDILDLSKVEAGKLDLAPEPLSLPEALQAVLAQLRPQADAKGLHLTLHLEEGMRPVTADPVRFNQILYNLLSNAVKFTPAGGTVTVAGRRVLSSGPAASSAEPFRVQRESAVSHELSTINHEPHGNFVEIAVADTGIGIKGEDLPKLFHEFTQLDASLARRHQGTGLGLALTKKLIELHGGRIWVESPGEGQGSTFTVTLPVDGLPGTKAHSGGPSGTSNAI